MAASAAAGAFVAGPMISTRATSSQWALVIRPKADQQQQQHLLQLHHRTAARLIARATADKQEVESTSTSSNASASQGASDPNKNKEIVPDTEWSITKTSFGTIGLCVGGGLFTFGFTAYFWLLPGYDWSALALTYGLVIAILGMALKYAEVKPVPCTTYADALALRESQATPTLKQLRGDVTSYTYGDEQHLEESLEKIFRYGRSGGISPRFAPVLEAVREEVSEKGTYSLVLVFKAEELRLDDFASRKDKFASFFGPGISAKIESPKKSIYEVKLISDGTPQVAAGTSS